MKKTVKIAIWPGRHDILGRAIMFLTHGKGSHAAFVVASEGDFNGEVVAEAFFPKVRFRRWNPGERETVEIYDLEGMRPEHHAELIGQINKELLKPRRYSIGDLFRYALNLPHKSEHGVYCSRWVLRCIRKRLPAFLYPLARLPVDDWASPRDLRISPRLKPETKSNHL